MAHVRYYLLLRVAAYFLHIQVNLINLWLIILQIEKDIPHQLSVGNTSGEKANDKVLKHTINKSINQ